MKILFVILFTFLIKILSITTKARANRMCVNINPIKYVFPYVLCCLCLFSQAQNTSNRVVKQIFIDSDTLILDSSSIAFGTLELQGADPSDYKVDYMDARLIILNDNLKGKNFTCAYRAYPYKFNQEIKRKDLSQIEKNLYDPVNPFTIEDEPTLSMRSFSDEMLNANGSLSRGISVGNSQDLIVNSNLNLQLSGKLSEDVEILANITDKNIPFQAEGNTRQLQEFDKIFIQLKFKDKAKLIAGDIENISENTYFMRYFKKGQGLMGDILFKDISKKNKDTTYYKVGVSGSIAKGTFQRQTIHVIEGIQGPYRLEGGNNESRIIVLAGSERVYVDGVLLVRGEDRDYVIDYNAGELTFMPRQPVTKDKRIVVEFEYSDQNYVRSLLSVSTDIKHKNLDFSFNFYNEQDFKNQSNQLDLTAENVAFLQAIGNDTENAYFPYIDSTGYNSNNVLYKRIDTLVDNIFYDSVFVYSTHPDSACYQLGFTHVGMGKGDYVLEQNIVNGRVYAWKAPINGIQQGDYLPVILLVTPKRIQMYSAKIKYQLPKNTSISLESALSNNDLNTFSSIGDAHNVGFGLRFLLENKTDLQKKQNLGKEALWNLQSSVYYEMKNDNFRYIEDYRDVEFTRNLNISDSMTNSADYYTGISFIFERKEKGFIGWTSNGYFIPEFNWKSIQNQLSTDFKLNRFKINIDASILNSNTETYKTLFFKHKETFSFAFRYIEIGIREEMELNQYQDNITKNIFPESFAFNEASLFFKQNDSTLKDIRYGISYTNRIDNTVRNNVLSTSSMAHNVNAYFDFLKNMNHPLRFTLNYRYLEYKDSLWTDQQPENTLLAGIDYQGRFCKGAIQWGIFYQVGSGMEQKNIYSYLKVPAGQGVYKWIDYNGNGVEELDEFEEAVYKDEANYIRIWQTSNDYIKTFNNKLTQSLILRPAVVWNNKKGFRKFIARFSNTSTFQTQLKQTASDFLSTINPFYSDLDDTALVSTQMNFRNMFSFNQSSPVWGIDLIYGNNKNKLLAINGFESASSQLWQVSGRCVIKQMFTVKINYYNSLSSHKSEYLSNKNYEIYGNIIEPYISYQYKNILTVNLLYAYMQKENLSDIEKSFTNKVTTEFNVKMQKRGQVLLQLNYYYIIFKGETVSSVAYEMLDALQPGHNGVFTLAYQTTLFQNLQLNIAYEGRISQGISMKHVGSVELRAYF